MAAGNITYFFYDLMSMTQLATLPVQGVSWSKKMNSAGTFDGKLNLADPRVQKKTWLAATRPARSMLFVDVDGAIEWAGIVWNRPYDSASRMLTIAGGEAWSYFTRRMQAKDYTTPPVTGAGVAYWTANPARADYIAAALIADVLAKEGSAFATMAIAFAQTATDPNTITESFPLTQRQTVASMVTTMASCGYGTGFDFSIQWSWSGQQGSTPVPTILFSYPRSGRIAGSTGLVIDAGTAGAEGYTWPEDGSQQANYLYGTASGTGTLYGTAGDGNVLTDGWPLLEDTTSYTAVNSQDALNAAVEGDLARLEWPVVTPTVTLPMFGTTLAIGDFTIGDTARVLIPPDERFATGLDTYLRITAMTCKPGDEGLAMMTLTLQPPPALAPVPPPPGL